MHVFMIWAFMFFILTDQLESVLVEVVDELLNWALGIAYNVISEDVCRKSELKMTFTLRYFFTLRYASCVSGAKPSRPIHSISYLE